MRGFLRVLWCDLFHWPWHVIRDRIKWNRGETLCYQCNRCGRWWNEDRSD